MGPGAQIRSKRYHFVSSNTASNEGWCGGGVLGCRGVGGTGIDSLGVYLCAPVRLAQSVWRLPDKSIVASSIPPHPQEFTCPRVNDIEFLS